MLPQMKNLKQRQLPCATLKFDKSDPVHSTVRNTSFLSSIFNTPKIYAKFFGFGRIEVEYWNLLCLPKRRNRKKCTRSERLIRSITPAPAVLLFETQFSMFDTSKIYAKFLEFGLIEAEYWIFFGFFKPTKDTTTTAVRHCEIDNSDPEASTLRNTTLSASIFEDMYQVLKGMYGRRRAQEIFLIHGVQKRLMWMAKIAHSRHRSTSMASTLRKSIFPAWIVDASKISIKF